MRKFMEFAGRVALAAILLTTVACGARAQQSGPPFNPDAYFGKTPGMIAVRGPTKWQAIPAGTAGQVLSSQGPSTVPSWITPSGTGNVQTDGNATAGQFPSFTNGTTLGHTSGGGTLLDSVTGISGTGAGTIGFGRRTAAGTYTWAAIAAGDLPAYAADTDASCTSAAGSGKISCPGIYTNARTLTAAWNAAKGLLFEDGTPAWQAGQISELNGELLDQGVNYSQLNAAGGLQYDGTKIGAFTRIDGRNNGAGGQLWALFTSQAGSGAQTAVLSSDIYGNMVMKSVAPTTPVAVANGGTGQTSGGGAALDAVSGLTGTGILQRTGTGAYALNSDSQYLDAYIGSAQGTIAYRNASGWTGLAPGSSGQFLATNGGGANPSWQSPSAPPAGSRVLLNTITISSGAASASDTTSISGSYTEYDVVFENLVPTGDSGYCQLTLTSGGSNKTTGYLTSQFNFSNYNGGSSGAASPTTFIPCSANSGSGDMPTSSARNSLSAGVSGSLHISRPALTNRVMAQVLYSQDTYNGSVAVTSDSGHASGYLSAGGAVTGFTFTPGTSTFASGTIKVYGSN